MGKMKVHELAKKIGKTSKEIITVAQELGLELKSHLSSLEDKDVEQIEKKLLGEKTETKSKKEEVKENKKENPVIIRRQVIISDEEIARREQEKKENEQKARKDVGFVERNKNKEYNIVYRNKPTKPMTASELFGFPSKTKKEEPKKEEIEQEKPKKEQEIQEVEEITTQNDESIRIANDVIASPTFGN